MSVLLQDNGTGTAGTSIAGQSLSPVDTTSTTWTVTGAFQYKSGGGFVFTYNQFNYAICDAGQADVNAFVQATTNGAGDVDAVGVIVRATGTSNLWLFWIRDDGTCDLYSNIAGTLTQVASTSFTPGSAFWTIKINASGATLTCFINGTQYLQYTNATFNQTATKCGMIGIWTSNPAATPSFTSFEVDSLTTNLTAVYGFPLEWQGTAATAKRLPVEVMTAAAMSANASVEWAAAARSVRIGPMETLAGSHASALLQFETIAAPIPFPAGEFYSQILTTDTDAFATNPNRSVLLN